ncbi:MAG: hypothetical protein RIF39_11055, partial [Cyclobacteriaceae bacterium]
MKNVHLVFVFLLSLIAFTHHAQSVKPLWSLPVAEGVKWQLVTSLGNYVAGTSQGLVGIDPESGKIIWKNKDLGALEADQVKQLGSSALLTIQRGTSLYIMDPFTGAIKFDSRAAGLSEINDQKVLYRANGILVSGRDAANKDLLLMSSLNDGKIVWKIDDDFGRLITTSELSSNELLIVTLYYNYKVNPATGEILWKNDVSAANQQMEKMGAFG